MKRTPIMPEQAATAHGPASCEDRVDAHLQRMQEDLVRLKRQIRHAQRLAALGTTAAMLAHEINNLLTPALGYAKYALSRNDAQLRVKALNTTVKQISSVITMSERVLGMAVDEPLARESVRLVCVVQDAVQCLCRDLKKDGITLTVDMSDDLTVRANPRQLAQVFFNLLLNARQALQDRTGRITVRANRIDEETVEVTLSDTGCGIAPDNLPSIFDDFFTTHNASGAVPKRGSGLGLSVCRDILSEHHGGITVQSRLGKGTTFTITLPVGD